MIFFSHLTADLIFWLTNQRRLEVVEEEITVVGEIVHKEFKYLPDIWNRDKGEVYELSERKMKILTLVVLFFSSSVWRRRQIHWPKEERQPAN